MTEEQHKFERVLFFVMTECLCRQIENLEPEYLKTGSTWLKSLLGVSKGTIKSMRKNMRPEAVILLEELYDHVYDTMRDATKVDNADIPEFRKLVQDWLATKYPEGKSSVLTIKQPETV